MCETVNSSCLTHVNNTNMAANSTEKAANKMKIIINLLGLNNISFSYLYLYMNIQDIHTEKAMI